MKWSADKEVIWGLLDWCSAANYFFFNYNYTTNTLKRFAVPEGLAFDYDINPNTGKLLYSDYPPTYAVGDDQGLIDTKKEIHLYLLDFATNKRTIVKTSIATKFNVKWVTNHLIEVSSDRLNHRVTLTLKN